MSSDPDFMRSLRDVILNEVKDPGASESPVSVELVLQAVGCKDEILRFAQDDGGPGVRLNFVGTL